MAGVERTGRAIEYLMMTKERNSESESVDSNSIRSYHHKKPLKLGADSRTACGDAGLKVGGGCMIDESTGSPYLGLSETGTLCVFDCSAT